jgi:hypothetical protein
MPFPVTQPLRVGVNCTFTQLSPFFPEIIVPVVLGRTVPRSTEEPEAEGRTFTEVVVVAVAVEAERTVPVVTFVNEFSVEYPSGFLS